MFFNRFISLICIFLVTMHDWSFFLKTLANEDETSKNLHYKKITRCEPWPSALLQRSVASQAANVWLVTCLNHKKQALHSL